MTARTLWEEGSDPGWQVVALGLALTLSAVALDSLVSPGLGWLYDVAFVLICVACALLVRPRDFFTVGVLPPLLMLVALVLLGATSPGSIARAQDGPVQAVVSGLADHALALVLGYALALGCLVVRDRVARAHGRGAAIAWPTRSARRRPIRTAAPRAPGPTSPRPS
ncbi:hypothetical protein I601_2071 [Nocardioides dokdonensis FR1436]|uniref:DUF6542 domain-containing protein n=1 Tax=Nocardioides dokdonensis FR1436 TaxID=1300347 RepID=A0A1A9GJN4_9ACTN|nr:DUF6542 domain-containing protein [Nocardioides dokdonensis]ANH38499.1 hypothetical protein I601_2071 [Nocardioides dokdonensis FR1436]